MSEKYIPSQEQLVALICARLHDQEKHLAQAFAASAKEVGVRFFALDDLLPLDVAEAIAQFFPEPGNMRLMDSFRERKEVARQLPCATNILEKKAEIIKSCLNDA